MQDSIAKEKKWGEKISGNFAIKGGGVGPLMANAILNFHFDFPHPSLNDEKYKSYDDGMNQCCLPGPMGSVHVLCKVAMWND